MIKCADGGYIMERADKEKELKRFVDRLDHAMDEVQIAINNLREQYGLEIINVSIMNGEHKVQLKCGIEELADVLRREIKTNARYRLSKEFRYLWATYTQLAEINSRNFMPLNYKGKAIWRLDDDKKEE